MTFLAIIGLMRQSLCLALALMVDTMHSYAPRDIAALFTVSRTDFVTAKIDLINIPPNFTPYSVRHEKRGVIEFVFYIFAPLWLR